MKVSDPSLSPEQTRAIERAAREELTYPLRFQGLVTADLPAAADYPYGGVFDITVGAPKFSDGANWLTLSLSTHTHTASQISDFAEAVDDRVGALIVDSSDLDATYSDPAGTISIAIKNDAVTYAKMQNVSATDKLLGRSTSGAGDVEEIACTAAGRAILDDADASAQRTTLGLGTMATQAANSVAITGGSVTGLGTFSVSSASSPNITYTGTAGGAQFDATNASFAGTVLACRANRSSATDTYWFISCTSDLDGTPDTEFVVNSSGTVKSDGGTAMTTPADFAHMREWADGNPDNEDRRGITVVFEPGTGGKIRPATKDDDPARIRGGIMWDPAICCGDDFGRWAHKYLTDDFNSPILEEFELVAWEEDAVGAGKIEHAYAADRMPEGVKVPKNATRTIEQRRKLNPAFDPERPHTPRRKRPEWDPMGHHGILRLRVGQPVNPGWEFLRTISAEVEEWWAE